LEMARRAGVRAIAVLGRVPTEKGLRAARPQIFVDSNKELTANLDDLRRA
jgi:hypothetical protein